MKRITTSMVAPLVAPALALTATQTFISQAQAQATSATEATIAGEKERPYSVRLGGSALSDGDTSDDTGRTGFLLGVSRDIGKAGRADLDFTRQSKNGEHIRTVGLSYLQRFPFGQTNRFYGGLGVGVYSVSVDTRGGGSGLGGTHESAIRPGGKILVGYQRNRLFTEAGYNLIGKVSGENASNFFLQVGLKF